MLIKRLEKAFQEVKDYEQGKIMLKDWEELYKELNEEDTKNEKK